MDCLRMINAVIPGIDFCMGLNRSRPQAYQKIHVGDFRIFFGTCLVRSFIALEWI